MQVVKILIRRFCLPYLRNVSTESYYIVNLTHLSHTYQTNLIYTTPPPPSATAYYSQ